MRDQTCIQERNGIWHIVDGHGDDTFRPIRCGRFSGQGIVMPGNNVKREPTCEECINLALSRASRDSQATKETT